MFNFILQDSPHQNLVGTILATGAIQCLAGVDSTLTICRIRLRLVLISASSTKRRFLPFRASAKPYSAERTVVALCGLREKFKESGCWTVL